MSLMYLRGEIPDPSAAKVNLYESVSEMCNPMDESDFTDTANYSQIREIKVSSANSLHLL